MYPHNSQTISSLSCPIPKSTKKQKQKKPQMEYQGNNNNGCGEIPEGNASLFSAGFSELKKKRKWKNDRNGDSVVEATTLSEENEPDGSNKLKRVDLEKKNEKKNKRKRDEVKAEYKAKRYGVTEQEQEEEKEEGGGVVGRTRTEMESLEDIMVFSREGFDVESKLLRTVFVGNLPLKIKKKVLVKDFGKFGEVDSVRIRSVPLIDSKIPRKGATSKQQFNEAINNIHAYVIFRTEKSAQASLAHNMSVIQVGGNHICVDRACPPRKKLKGGGDAPSYDNRRTVFIGNLPFDAKDEELFQLFNNIKDLESSIEAIRVIRDPGTSMGKGIAYVLFKTREVANLAARKHRLKLQDHKVRVAHSKADATPSKRKTTPSKRKAPLQLELEMNKSPAKKFVVQVGYPCKENSVKRKVPLSCQGLQGSKSANRKKTYNKLKERTQKRPAVAAGKAKAVKSHKAGLKRNYEKQTADSNGRQKKARKFK